MAQVLKLQAGINLWEGFYTPLPKEAPPVAEELLIAVVAEKYQPTVPKKMPEFGMTKALTFPSAHDNTGEVLSIWVRGKNLKWH